MSVGMPVSNDFPNINVVSTAMLDFSHHRYRDGLEMIGRVDVTRTRLSNDRKQTLYLPLELASSIVHAMCQLGEGSHILKVAVLTKIIDVETTWMAAVGSNIELLVRHVLTPAFLLNAFEGWKFVRAMCDDVACVPPRHLWCLFEDVTCPAENDRVEHMLSVLDILLTKLEPAHGFTLPSAQPIIDACMVAYTRSKTRHLACSCLKKLGKIDHFAVAVVSVLHAVSWDVRLHVADVAREHFGPQTLGALLKTCHMEAKGCIDAKVHLSLLGLGLVLVHHNPHTDTLHFVAQELSGVTFQILNCHTLNKAIWRTGLRFLMWLIQDLPGFYECYRDTITMLVPKANFLGMEGPAKTLLELKYLVRASLFHACCAPLENKPFHFPLVPLAKSGIAMFGMEHKPDSKSMDGWMHFYATSGRRGLWATRASAPCLKVLLLHNQ